MYNFISDTSINVVTLSKLFNYEILIKMLLMTVSSTLFSLLQQQFDCSIFIYNNFSVIVFIS